MRGRGFGGGMGRGLGGGYGGLGGGLGRGSARGLGSGGGLGGGGLGRGAVNRGGNMGRPIARGPGMGGFGMGLGMGMLMGGGRRRGWGGVGTGGPGGGCGCSGIVLIFVFIIVTMIVLTTVSQCAAQPGGGTGITQTTRVRDPLPPGSFSPTTGLISDSLGIIGNVTIVERGMLDFQDRTGVRPHLFTAGPDSLGMQRPSDAELIAAAEAAFWQLGLDSAHFMFLYFQNDAGEFGFGAYAGAQAQLVMDREAVDILFDFVDSYDARGLNASQTFGNAFAGAAERIMHRPMDMRPVIIAVAVIGGIVLIGFMIYNNAKRRQEEEKRRQEEAERILSQPLEKFGDEADRLAKQYEDE